MVEPLHVRSKTELIQALQEQLRPPLSPSETLSSGAEPLNRLLPGGGFRRGSLVEWLSAEGGSGAGTLALFAAREACRSGGALVVVDRLRKFYPPAAAGLGIDLGTLIVVLPTNRQDELWALDQVLRCSGVAAALCWPDKIDGRAFRRFQLAAETGKSLGLLVRPESVRGEPSWADVRLLVQPSVSTEGRQLRVELMHCRHGKSGEAVELGINHETGMIYETRPVPLDSELAHPASRRHSAGA